MINIQHGGETREATEEEEKLIRDAINAGEYTVTLTNGMTVWIPQRGEDKTDNPKR